MAITPTRIALGTAIVLVAWFAWRVGDGEAWRCRLSDRFIVGVPWGTLVTVVVVVAFYLFVQGGLRNPRSPVVYPFVSWSYFYPTGILTAGIAHGNPAHLISNMSATLVLGPIAEYVWSHYPRGGDGLDGKTPPTNTASSGGSARRTGTDGGTSNGAIRVDGGSGPLDNPWFRAVVVFPAALLSLAFLTAAFSLGPGLGFSGAVYAVIGFVVVARPLTAVVGVVASAAASTLFAAFTQPTVRETLAAGAPMPPSWAGVGFQAHLLGFLIGALLAVALTSARRTRPEIGWVLFGALLVGLVQSVWLVTGGGGDEFVLYRGAGVTFLLGLVVVIAVAAGGSRRPLIDSVPFADRYSRTISSKDRGQSEDPDQSENPEQSEDRGQTENPVLSEDRGQSEDPGRSDGSERTSDSDGDDGSTVSDDPPTGTRGRIAMAWLAIVSTAGALAAGAFVAIGEFVFLSVGATLLIATLLALPAVPSMLPDRLHAGPLSRRDGAALALVALTLLVSVPTVAFGLIVVDDPDLGGSTGIEVRDYTVAYVSNESTPQTPVVDLGEGRFDGTTDGVVVTSDEREIWTLAERPEVLAHEGSATVVVGGVGWREEVSVERVAWDVVGDGTAYVVDIEHDGAEVRSYVGDAVRTETRVDGYELHVVPTADGFDVAADHDGVDRAIVTIPETGAEATLGDLVVRTETIGDDGTVEDGGIRLVVEGGDAVAVIAERAG